VANARDGQQVARGPAVNCPLAADPRAQRRQRAGQRRLGYNREGQAREQRAQAEPGALRKNAEQQADEQATRHEPPTLTVPLNQGCQIYEALS
jgi:hypothetical protein